MEMVNLELGENSYKIHIAPGLMGDSALLRAGIRGGRALIVTNETIAPLYLEKLKASLDGLAIDVLLLPDGEQYKTLESFEKIIGYLLEREHNRSTTIVALGGGVVGDTAGYAAACYQRGVDFIQVPTTLLSQVDSSVGGKTAVNHPRGKNMIGAFYQPRAVYIDTNTLKTLPAREVSAGFAEVIKHGALADADFFFWLEDNVEQLMALEESSIAYAIKRCCEIKSSIVSLDEKEHGARALLNLGHTFGHAIETSQGYGTLLHGEAVGTGLVMAADLSMRLGKISTDDAMRLKTLVTSFGLPAEPPASMTRQQFLDLMRLDKKTTDQGMRFVVLRCIGEAVMDDNIDVSILAATLEAKSGLCQL